MIPEPRIDPTVINELIDLGPETGLQLVKDLLQLFSGEAPLRLGAMRDGLRQHDFKELASAAHAMRGGAGNLGALRVGVLCSRIEVEAKTGNVGAIGPLIDEVEAELAYVQRELAERLARMQKGEG